MDFITLIVFLAVIAGGALAASHLKKRKEDKAEVPPDTDTPHVPTFNKPHVVAPQKTIDYSAYAGYDYYTLQTTVFYNGFPTDWDPAAWALAAGKEDPRIVDTRGRKIEPMPPFEDPNSLTDNGEMDLDLGESKTITLTKGGKVTWVAHAPQYVGSATVRVGGHEVTGAYVGIDLGPGVHTITLESGPKQGMRVAVRTPN
jgi:hypothetical protein